MKITVFGPGAWGTALAEAAATAGHDVFLWATDDTLARDINSHKSPFLPGIRLHENIFSSTNMDYAYDTDAWILASPAEFFRETTRKSRCFYKNQPILICSKGIDTRTGATCAQMARDILGNFPGKIAVLSGPNFAAEVARGMPAGATIGGTRKTFEIFSRVLPAMELERTNDLTGVEICGLGKNIAAVYAGFISNLGENERAMRTAQIWREIMDIGVSVGARAQTFNMLCGLGDLLLTATSQTSRNFTAGMALAAGKKTSNTAEGLTGIKTFHKIARKNNLKTPVFNAFYASLKKIDNS
ncbi:MAG: hypothetical protein LBR41_01175 [Rickettsiales bacterium]|jgi:glycerol-3-phosphate dehydrogenase (NAD(P)+)|nr:hypothetical protein [Rickettsiales bacterium]